MSDDYSEILKRAVAAPFGKAEGILKDEGYWDEEASGKPVSAYRVRVNGEIHVSAIVTVEARSEEEAFQKAMKKAEAPGFDWDEKRDVDITGAFRAQ